MADRTGIEWCTTTINLIPGCSDALLPDGTVSPACAGCFAKRIAARLADNPKTPLTVRPWLPARDDRARAAFTRQTGLVPVFVKQLGTRPAFSWESDDPDGFDKFKQWLEDCERLKHKKCGDPAEWPADLRVREFPEEASRG